MTNAPAVSVIIPMFNAAKYVGQCLESLLAQTFQDFEVIIADDCSTDSSAAIVESFAPKFNGRLMLLQLDSNTGSGAVPRNTGLKFARGEYVFFADADDMLTLTALEELYALAEDYDAEVVYCEKYYKASADLSEIVVHSRQHGNNFVTRPTFESEDIPQRIQKIFARNIWLTPWCKFVRRDLLIDNELFFPPVIIAEDDIWTYGLLFHAKKFLRVPNVVYVWRQTEDSMLRRKRSPQQVISALCSPVILGLNTLDQFMLRAEFFRQNQQYRYAVLEYFIDDKTDCLSEKSTLLAPIVMYETLLNHFEKDLENHNSLVSALCTFICTCQKRLRAKDDRLKNLSEQFERTVNELERKLEEKFS